MRLAKIHIILGVILLCGGQAWGASYYVDCDAEAGGDGSLATPWDAVADVNGASFSAGDNVYFKRGCEFREKLTVPSSGSDGSPITFSSYGTGDNPILNGSDVESAYWEPYGGSFADAFTMVPTTELGAGARNYRLAFDAGTLSASGIKIKVTVAANATVDGVITASTVGPMASSYVFDSAPTTITWGGGNPGVTVTAGTTATSDEITFAWNAAARYGIHFTMTSRAFKIKGTTGNGWGETYDDTDVSTVLNPPAMAWSSSTSRVMVTKIEVYNNTTGVWYVAKAADPFGVWEDGTALTRRVDNVDGVVANAGHFYYDTTNLYIHTTDNSNPNTSGKVYEVASDRVATFLDNGEDWIVLENIDQVQSAGGDLTMGGIVLTGNNNIVRNLTSRSHRRHNASFYTNATDCLFENLTLYDCTATSVIAGYGATTSGNTIRNCTIYNASTATSGAGPPIRLHGEIDDTTIEGNTLSDSSPAADTYLVDLYDSGTTNVIIRHNSFSGDYSNAIRAQNITGLEVYNNDFIATDTSGPVILLDASTGSLIYHNSIYGDEAQFAVSQINAATGTVAKNNVFYLGKYVSVPATSQTDTVYDNNIYFGASGTPFTWGVDNYNFADWKTNSSQDANSLSVDPQFRNAAGGDFYPLNPLVKNAGTGVLTYAQWVAMGGDRAGKYPTGSAATPGAYQYQEVLEGIPGHPWMEDLYPCPSSNTSCYAAE